MSLMTKLVQRGGGALAGLQCPAIGRWMVMVVVAAVLGLFSPGAAFASSGAGGAGGVEAPVFQKPGGEANLVIPDLNNVKFFGIGGHDLLLVGFGVSALGLLFGAVIFLQLKKLPVHKSMLEVSELIYTTCKAYMIQQGKFLAQLFIFIGAMNLPCWIMYALQVV